MQTNKIKILNLYACLGGNRLKWDTVANIEVTAVELDPVLAALYQERFPSDKVIVADAHQFLVRCFLVALAQIFFNRSRKQHVFL